METENKKPLTDEEYVATYGGGVCPLCRSDQIEGGSVDIDGTLALQKVCCLDCNANWVDIYHLNGYANLCK